ncbi:MAG: hypothetical protein V7L25_01880 [Nostoc sp.]|uniref:hypothetical protein n=1 Tax=Nostoc sp. TaxID=1180 RepID=UPI002FF10747
MKTRNVFVKLTICVLLALTTTFFMNLPRVLAHPTTDCRLIVTGTYLTTTSGNFGSYRSLVTFTQDGNFFASASNQSGDSVVKPYGNSQGSWKCTSSTQITATILNFIYPTATLAGAIARGDLRATFDPKNGIVQATATLKEFALNADPLNDHASITGTITFTGQRVKPGQ